MIPMLIESKTPVVTGSTGFEWPTDLDQQLKSHKLKWIHGGNFSLGMTIICNMIKELSKAQKIFSDYDFHLSETHHVHKKDAPSGTAILWKKWLNAEIGEIESKREGDVVGIHQIELNAHSERITLKHEAQDRKIFAQGAIWAARKLVSMNKSGLFEFEDVIKTVLSE